MKNVFTLLLLSFGLIMASCQSESSTKTAQPKADIKNPQATSEKKVPTNNDNSKVVRTGKFDASNAQATSPLKTDDNKTAVKNASKSIKKTGSPMPAKAQEKLNKLRKQKQAGILQQKQQLQKDRSLLNKK